MSWGISKLLTAHGTAIHYIGLAVADTPLNELSIKFARHCLCFVVLRKVRAECHTWAHYTAWAVAAPACVLPLDRRCSLAGVNAGSWQYLTDPLLQTACCLSHHTSAKAAAQQLLRGQCQKQVPTR